MITHLLNKIRISVFMLIVCLGTVPMQAQQEAFTDSISGKVIDAASLLPVLGITVKSGDGQYSTLTNNEGCFVLKIAVHQYVLMISADGYRATEHRLSGQNSDIVIPLHRNNLSVNYELIAGDFRLMDALEKNRAQTTFNNEMPKTDIAVESMIQNNLGASVRTVMHSGIAAGGASMFVRGLNSLNTHLQPLIVIDGVVFDNLSSRSSIHVGSFIDALSCIDVNDIKNISVLKDGTSIYGSKGANGVILIATKRGESMITHLTVNAMYGINDQPNVLPVMGADDYRIYLSNIISGTEHDLVSDLPFLNDDESSLYYQIYHNNSNWSNEVYRRSVTKSYNVNVNGGDERALYNLSLGYTGADNGLKNNDFSRLNARFNSDIVLSPSVKLKFDINYSSTTREMRNDGISGNDEEDVMDSPGLLSLIKSPFLAPYQYTNSGIKSSTLEDYDFLGYANPNAILKYGEGGRDLSNFTVALTPEVKITSSLKLINQFCYTLTDISENFFRPMSGVAPYYNRTLGIISYNQVKSMFGRYQSEFNNVRLMWTKNLPNADVYVNVGNRFMNEKYKTEYASGHNTGSDQVKEMSSSLSYKTVDGTDENMVSVNNYAAVDYELMKKYLVSLVLSAETNSRFGDEVQNGIKAFGQSWGVFPSINVAWNVAYEDFMANVDGVSALKLRVGYGMSGNDDFEPFTAQSYFSADQYFENAVGLSLNNIANPEIQWESTTKRDIGLDISLFNDRLSLVTDLYHNTTKNLLVEKDLKQISGKKTYWSNDGELENSGFEVGARVIVLERKHYSVEVGANVAHYKNNLIALSDGDYTKEAYDAEILFAENHPAGLFYGYKTDGVYATADEASAANLTMKTSTGTSVSFEAGDVMFVDLHEDNVIDENDKTVIGDPNPDWYGNFHVTVNYKNLSLSAGFNFLYGNDVYNCLRSKLESGSELYNQSTSMINRWTNEGQVTTMPKATYGDPMGNSRFSDRWIEDGSYLKFKTLEISYKIPVNVSFIQGLSIWCSAKNLFTLTKYLGVDPEVSAGNSLLYQGIDVGLLPQSRGYYAGIKISL